MNAPTNTREGEFIRWGEWDEDAFGVVHVEEELEESIDNV